MAKASQTTAENGESTIHLTLQGKGGVGKSLIAAILAQFFQNLGRDVLCIDTDPVNRTFAQYAALSADRLQLRDEHNRIDQRSFDILMERFLTEDSATFVVDNGASTFLPLWHYLLENNALDYLRASGRKVYVHTVITGGQALVDTLNGFHELAQTTHGRNIVVWVNEYFGRVEADGKKLSDMTAFRENADKICGAVVIPKRNQDTVLNRCLRRPKSSFEQRETHERNSTPNLADYTPNPTRGTTNRLKRKSSEIWRTQSFSAIFTSKFRLFLCSA